jgi:tetratricopeptide (TPR) repeat protein
MRIGEILVEAAIIDAKALKRALDYALEKRIPVGRALRALQYLDEETLVRGLDAQKALRKGLDLKLTVETLHFAEQTSRSFLEALRAYPGILKNRIPPGFIISLEGGALEKTKVNYKPTDNDRPVFLDDRAPPGDTVPVSPSTIKRPQAAAPPKAVPGVAKPVIPTRPPGAGAQPAAPQPAPASAPVQPAKAFVPTQPPAQPVKPPAAAVPPPVQPVRPPATPIQSPVQASPPVTKPSAAPLPIAGGASSITVPHKTAEDLIREGDQLLADNKCFAAERSYELAWRLLEERPNESPERIAAVILKLANLHISADRPIDAETLYTRALDIQTRLYGKNSLPVATTLGFLTDVKLAQGQIEMARAMVKQALSIMESAEPDDAVIVARLLGKLHTTHGQDQSRERTRVGELAVDAGLLVEDDVRSALIAGELSAQPLGVILRGQKRLNTQQVESLMYAQLLVHQGTISQPVAVQSLRMACAMKTSLRQLLESGQWLPATAVQDESYKTLVYEMERLVASETSLGAGHPELVPILVRLGDFYCARRDRTNAELMYKRALRILDKWDTDTKSMMSVCEKLSQVFCQQNKYADAQPLLARAFDLRKNLGQGETLDAAKCVWLMGKVELLVQNHATACAFLQSAREMFAKLNMPCPRALLDELLVCLNETRSTTDIEAVLHELIAMTEKAESLKLAAAQYMEQLGDFLVSNDRREDARSWYRSSLDIYERSPESDAKMQELSRKLSEVSLII